MIENLAPPGWNTFKLGELGIAIIGLTYSPYDVVDKDGTIVLRSSNIQKGRIDLRDQVRVNVKVPKKLRLQHGDILICARNGSRNLIGKSVYIDHSVAGQTFGAFMSVYRTEQPKYMSYLFQSHEFKKMIARDLGPTINQVTTGNLSSFKFPFPPLEEQKRIVTVLEVWVEYLEKLESKIHNVKKLKTGIVQRIMKSQLTTSKLEWKYQKFDEVLHEHCQKASNGEPVFSVSVSKGLVNQIQHLGRSFAAKDTSNYNVVNYGDIVYTKSPTGNFPLGIIKQSHYPYPVAVSPLYAVYKPKTFGLGLLLHEYFASPVAVKNYLNPLVQKGAKNTIAITNKTFISRGIELPCDVGEQEKIGEILATLNTTISVLEEKKQRIELQKKYLLNKLVTGKIRIPEGLKIPKKEPSHG